MEPRENSTSRDGNGATELFFSGRNLSVRKPTDVRGGRIDACVKNRVHGCPCRALWCKNWCRARGRADAPFVISSRGAVGCTEVKCSLRPVGTRRVDDTRESVELLFVSGLQRRDYSWGEARDPSLITHEASESRSVLG